MSAADYELTEGVTVTTRVTVRGQALKSFVPYELFCTEIMRNNTGSRRRAVQSFFSKDEIDQFPAMKVRAERWMSSGPSAVILTVEEFRMWRRVSKFISEVVCKRRR